MAGKLFADDGRDQARGEHSVGDAALEDGVLGVLVVQMDGVPVGRNFGEFVLLRLSRREEKQRRFQM